MAKLSAILDNCASIKGFDEYQWTKPQIINAVRRFLKQPRKDSSIEAIIASLE